MEIKGPIGSLFKWLFRIWTTRLIYGIKTDGKFHIEVASPGVRPESMTGSIERRLAHLDLAREGMLAALQAIDELKEQAQKNVQEAALALERFNEISNQKTSIEQKLQDLKHIAETDINTFKEIAGVPTRRQIAVERLLGFIIGVLASLIASILFWVFTKS